MRFLGSVILLFILIAPNSSVWAAGECGELKTFLDLALRRSRTVTQASRFERRIDSLSNSEQVRVLRGENYVEAKVVRYEDGELIYKIGDGPEVPYSLEGKSYDEFNSFLRIADEIPPSNVMAEGPAAPSFSGGGVLDETGVTPGFADGSVTRIEAPDRPVADVRPEGPPTGVVPPTGPTGVMTDAPVSPSFTTGDDAVSASFGRTIDVEVDPSNVTFGRIEAPDRPVADVRPEGPPTGVVPPTGPTGVMTDAPVSPSFTTGDDAVSASFGRTIDVEVDPSNVTFGRIEAPDRPVADVRPDNLPARIPSGTSTAVEVVTEAPGALNGGVVPGTDLVPSTGLSLTRVDPPDTPPGLAQIEGPDDVPRIEGPAEPLRIEAAPSPALLEGPEPRLAIAGPDDGLRGGDAPRYAPDVVRPTRANFPDNLEGEVISFTSPSGGNITRGEVVRINDASVVVRLADNTTVRKPYVDISADSIQVIRPRPAAFVARATGANFPESSIGEVMTFTTPAGRRTSTGRVVRVFDESVVIELADGTLVNERFRNISAVSVGPKTPIPAAFVERPTRVDFPDTLIGRSVTFSTPGGRNTTTGIVQSPINGQSVNVLLADGTTVNKRFRDMSRASVAETPVPAIVRGGDRAVVVAGDGAEVVEGTGTALSLNRGPGTEVTRTGTEVVPYVHRGEVVEETGVVPRAERAAIEADPIDAEYRVLDDAPGAINDARRSYDSMVQAIPSPAETMPPQGFIDTYGTENIRFTLGNGDEVYGSFTRVEGNNVVFTNFDGTSRVIDATTINPRNIDVASLEPFKRSDVDIAFTRGDEPFNGPFGARGVNGEELGDDLILRMLTSGSRLVRRTGQFLEFISRTGQRFRIPLRRLVDSGVTMASKAGDLRMNLNRMNILARSLNRVGDLDSFRLEEDGPTTAADGDPDTQETPAETAVEETTVEETPDEETTGPFNPDAPGSNDGNDEGGETDDEVEGPLPIPPAGRGNPVRPGSAPMQKLNIIRTRGVL